MKPYRPGSRSAPLCVAQDLAFDWPDRPLWRGLSFAIVPGLTWVRGGDGRGKTTLLRLLAGQLAPTGGRLLGVAGDVCFTDPDDPALDAVTLSDWLDRQARSWPAWNAEVAREALEGLSLGPHRDKTMAMLSRGSRRKPALVVAAASGAALTLLDLPYAALDRPSSQWLTACLQAAATDRRRAWVLADYTLPPDLDDLPLAGLIDLDASGEVG
jgi:ABC-type multidrug transport system ATPase subunit